MFVYVIVNSETLKIYVGQHKRNCLQKYLKQKISHAIRGESERSHLYAAMRKHPKECWSIHPLISGLQTRAECDEWERHFIKALKTQHPEVGYNICRGGEGFSGPFTDEHRAKLRAAIANRSPEVKAALRKNLSEKMKGVGVGNTRGRGNKGKHYPKSEEFRRQVSKTLTGRKVPKERVQKGADTRRGKVHQVTPEGRVRMATMKGKTHSVETLAKMSDAHRGVLHTEKAKQKMRRPKSPEAVQHMTESRRNRVRTLCPHGGVSRKCRMCGRARYKKWYGSQKS
jgi:GIY-YIG catalytic domain-containing protein/NUMOD3 motif-containing protein